MMALFIKFMNNPIPIILLTN